MNVNKVVNSSVKKHKTSRSIKTFKQFLEITRNLIKDCILLSAKNSAKFEITDANFHVPIITLSTKDNVNLTKQLKDEFKRSVYQNNYGTIPAKVINNETNIHELLSASFQGVKSLLLLDFDATTSDDAGLKDNRKYFTPTAEIKNYNVLINGINFYDQTINDSIKQHDEVRKTSTGQGDDYNTGCLLDYPYLKDIYRLMAVDLFKQKAQMLIQEQFNKYYFKEFLDKN